MWTRAAVRQPVRAWPARRSRKPPTLPVLIAPPRTIHSPAVPDLDQSFPTRRRAPRRVRFPLLVLAALLTSALGACSDRDGATPPPPPSDPPGPADHLRLNEAWLIGTHNAYWVDRGVSTDLFSSGVQESLLDQLVADGARSLELDVHPDDDRPHRFRVHHTVAGNSLCADLGDCLRPLRLFHAAFPRHEPLHVVVELKKFSGSSFDAEHTVDDLEAVLEESLGEWLYRPRDLLAQCDPDGTDPDPDLAACLATTGWPTIAELRGRVLVSVLGNFDDLLPQAKGTVDWAQFTLHGDLRQRSAFSMASSWKLDWDSLPEKIRLEMSREDLARALRRTVFLQVESADDPNLAPFLAGNGMVRMGGAYTLDDQRERIALGAQILQGDTPWIAVEDRGPAQPMRPFDPSLGEIVEPGEKFGIPAAAGGEAWSTIDVTSTHSRIETLPAVSAESDAVPCLVAMSGEDPSFESVALCRDKVRAPRTPNAPLGSGDPDAEKLRLRLRLCRAGACSWSDVRPEGNPTGAPGIATLAEQAEIGAALALEVERAGGGSCVQGFVATDLDERSRNPVWHALGARGCSTEALTEQGMLAIGGTASGSVLFGGTRLATDGRAAAVAALSSVDPAP